MMLKQTPSMSDLWVGVIPHTDRVDQASFMCRLACLSSCSVVGPLAGIELLRSFPYYTFR